MAVTLRARDFCDPVTLDVGGTISISGLTPIPVTSTAAVYSPACTSSLAQPIILTNTLEADADDITYSDFRDPFYASTFPQCYALAATTVIAYMLVIMLLITPRSFLDGGVQVLGRRAGFTSSPSSAASIGGRPWLQKVAALTVAISLTIASAETFKEAELQYSWGVENAKTIQREVLGGTFLKIIRLISSTFLWMAQAQTLLRLFPRHREKVIIKWTAAALISLDLIFDTLNSFIYVSVGSTRPSSFTQAIPALNYLFQLALGLLYAAWVIYYSLGKKCYAFYHRQMPNMVLVAFLSLIAILVPVVFFVLDISKPDFAGWGDYVRWVGAAAASVLVWEWVERIEALEREDKKDGVLGREILDGDDMIDDRSSRRKKEADLDGHGNGGPDSVTMVSRKLRGIWSNMSSPFVRRKRRARSNQQSRPEEGQQLADLHRGSTAANETRENGAFEPPLWPSRPPPARTPGNRTDSSSPSTVFDPYQPYNRHLPPSMLSEPPPEPISRTVSRASQPGQTISPVSNHSPGSPPMWMGGGARRSADDTLPIDVRSNGSYQTLNLRTTQNVSRGGDEPPNEVAPHLAQAGTPGPAGIGRKGSNWNIKTRLEDYAATKVDKWKSKIRDEPSTRHLPTVVIPPPPGPAIESPEIQEEIANLQRSTSRQDQLWPQGKPPSIRNIGESVMAVPAAPTSIYPAGGPPSIAPFVSAQDGRAATAPPGPEMPSYHQASQSSPAAESERALSAALGPSAPTMLPPSETRWPTRRTPTPEVQRDEQVGRDGSHLPPPPP